MSYCPECGRCRECGESRPHRHEAYATVFTDVVPLSLVSVGATFCVPCGVWYTGSHICKNQPNTAASAVW